MEILQLDKHDLIKVMSQAPKLLHLGPPPLRHYNIHLVPYFAHVDAQHQLGDQEALETFLRDHITQ